MKRSRKSKGVSWAHGVNLCQVKLFSSEDCPSKVGLISLDQLQAKSPRMLHPSTAEFNDCPPGFEVTPSGNQLADFSSIPLIKWRCPPKFVVNSNWCVAAGEESRDVESQKLREMRFLEAVYPRASAIPTGATVSPDIENETYVDRLTPLVPITPIEEDDCEDLESDSAVVGNFPTSSMTRTTVSNIQLEPATEKLPDVGVDVAAAASAALAVLMKSMEQGSMIDTNLLIEIFNDPKMIQNLANIPLVSEAISRIPSIAPAAPSLPKLPNVSLPRASNPIPSTVSTAMSTIPTSEVNIPTVPSHFPVPNPNKVKITVPNSVNYPKIGAMPAQAKIAPVSSVSKGQERKDLNYYKNLVRQHGDERNSKEHKFGKDGNNHNNHHNMKMANEMKSENNLKQRKKTSCNYFNTPKGCRNGINCQFKHDIKLENQNAKRMKLYGEVNWRT